MASILQSFRFAVGLAMVTAGIVAAAPYAASLVAAHGRMRSVEPAPETVAWVREAAIGNRSVGAGHESPAAAAPVASPGDPLPWSAPDVAGMPGEASPPLVPRADYRPPEPPAMLPPVATDFSRTTPAVAAAYRSTLDVPPPPLLDADTPPPLAVAWSAGAGASRAARAASHQPAADPSMYVVRDGDDLTGIAMKLYGHAGGAQAIWAVNRDRLADPNLLPIGLELRIPPAWSVPAVQPNATAGQVIEPGRRPGRVRVAPGETLESLAERFYGDRAMAPRLFEANRDQLRNPALVVAGMELRLP